MIQENKLRNILMVVNIILLIYFTGLLLYSKTRAHYPTVEVIAETITIPLLLTLCIGGVVSLVKWIVEDKFQIKGYFVPLFIALIAAAMLFIAE